MSWERDPMSWERDKYFFFTCPLSAAVIFPSFSTLGNHLLNTISASPIPCQPYLISPIVMFALSPPLNMLIHSLCSILVRTDTKNGPWGAFGQKSGS